MEEIGRLFFNLQLARHLPQKLSEAVPFTPATVRDAEVPSFFRECYVHTGYRPLHQSWRYYFLSLFQRHNETLNVWTHLLGALAVLAVMARLAESVDFLGDPHSWPLLVLLLSSATYMTFSATAHLFGSKSELVHYGFFFLDYVGVAQYQYGSAVAHYYYAVEQSWYRRVSGIFMPVASLFCCLSCLGSCYGKYQNYNLPPWVRKVGQVVPSALAYLWDTGPVFHRIMLWCLSGGEDPGSDGAVVYHCGQVTFFLAAAFFFTHPLPESLFPGRCDFLGHSHQVFHVFLVLCTLSQIHASHLDYLHRRHLYTRLHGDREALYFVVLYVVTVAVCAQIAVCVIRKVSRLLDLKDKAE